MMFNAMLAKKKQTQHTKKFTLKWEIPLLNAAKFSCVLWYQAKKSVTRITKLNTLGLYELTQKVYMKHKTYIVLYKITI